MAYYSKLHPTVYHECKNCHVGNNMVEGNMKKGTPPIVIDGKSLKPCKVCEKLKAKGPKAKVKCIPGIPILPRPYKGAVVETYYSKERPEIFHMCQNCHLGQNIDENNLVVNQPPLPMKRKKPRLCKTCARLCIAGKCVTGTPIPAELLESAYYSTAHARPKTFHICDNCYIGNNLQAKAKGEPYRARLCKVCYRLHKEGKCF
jgi:hypothetical protein